MCHPHPSSSLLATILLLLPLPALAQQGGAVQIANTTSTTIRIGCDHYIDNNGIRIDLKSYWDLSPGSNVQLTTQTGQLIVAKKFVFYEITPEGETSGWFFDKTDAKGRLYGTLTNEALGSHRMKAAIGTSGYPALTTRDVNIISFNDAIAQGQNRLKQLDAAIFGFQVGVTSAKEQYNNLANDPNTPGGKKILAAIAITTAEALLSKAVSERETVQTNLTTNQTRLNQLLAQPN